MARKPKFYVGQIVRKKAYDNPIGPYLRVEVVEKDRIYASMLNIDTPNTCLLKDNVYAYKMRTLTISESALNDLISGRRICIQHTASKRWLEMLDNPTELVRFITLPKHYENIFVVEKVTRVIYPREQMIRIIIANRVL